MDDDLHQLATDWEEMWMLMHVRLGKLCAERKRLVDRQMDLDKQITHLLEDIAELREEMGR